MLDFILKAISRAFGFSKVETRGTLLLILIIFTSLIASRVYIQSLKSKTMISEAEKDELRFWIAEVKSSYEQKDTIKVDKRVYAPSQKYYTENRSKPAEFPKYTNQFKKEPSKTPSITNIRDLNKATAEALQEIRGIGPAFSSRIIKYRNKLGGFVSGDQLSEVYGLPPETIEELLKHYTIQSSPKPIDINSDSVKVLINHPYINYDLAWIIINYRKQNGDITSAEDLRKIKAIDEETLVRLKPYLE